MQNRHYRILVVGGPGEGARSLWQSLAEDWTCETAHAETLREAVERLAGPPPDVVFLDLFLPDAAGLAALALVQLQAPGVPVVVLATPEEEPLAIRAVHQGAREYVLKDQLHPTLLRRVTRYVVEREEAERVRRESEARYHSLFEQSSDAIYITSVEGKLVDVNPAFLALLGYPRADLERMHASELYAAPADRERLREEMEEKGVARDFPVRLRRMDGEVLDCLVSATARRGPEGRAEEYQGIVRDVTEQVAAARARAAAHERLEHVLAVSPTVIYNLEIDGGVATPAWVSDNVTGMLGYDPAEVLAPGWWRAGLHPDDRERVAPYLSRLSEHGKLVCEYRFRHRDGRYLWVQDQMRLVPPRSGDGVEVVGSLTDITELKSSQEALRQSETSYRSLFDSITEMVYIQDPDGRFLDVNTAVMDAYGYTREEILGNTPALLLDLEGSDAVEVWASFRRALGGRVERVECRGRRKDGTVFPKEITLTRGVYFGQDVVTAVARDVSERKEAEAAVLRSRDYYHSLLDRLPTLVWRSDTTGRCDYFNRSWLEFTGRASDEELGDGWAEGVHPEDLERCLRTYRAALAAREPFEMEYRLHHHGGSYRWVLDVGTPMYNAAGVFQGYVGGAIDIHDQRRLEAELRQAQKMEAVGRLAGGVAHDFNNLLTAIKANTQFLLEDLPAQSPSFRDAQEVLQAADRAAELTRQLLAFSRKQVLQARVVDLNELVGGLERMLVRLIGEDVEFVSRLSPALGTVRVDPGQMEQVLMNLAVNARDAMPDGGKLTVETRDVEVDGGYAQRHGELVRPGRYVMLAVSDTGHGMTREVRERAFEPFFTTKGPGKGTGLGLSTVYGIVQQSGGFVWVYSEEGEGTTFKIYLPAADESARPARSAVEPGAAPRRSGVILLVEDERAVRRVAKLILERSGYAVLEAGSGAEALRICEEHPGPIHLLVTDVVMPGMNGRTLSEKVRVLRPEAKALFMSGYTDEAIVRHGVLEEGTEFIQKPFTPHGLARKVAAVMDATE